MTEYYPCGAKRNRIFTNSNASIQKIMVSVKTSCGDRCSLVLINKSGDEIEGTYVAFEPPGGTATMLAGAGQTIVMTCFGGDESKNGCGVDITVLS